MAEGVWAYENLQRHAHGANPNEVADRHRAKTFSQNIYAHRRKPWTPYVNPIPLDRAPDGYTHPLLRSCSMAPLAFKNPKLQGRPASAGATRRSGAALLARATSCPALRRLSYRGSWS